MKHPAALNDTESNALPSAAFEHKEPADNDCGLPENPIFTNYSKYLWKGHSENRRIPRNFRSLKIPVKTKTSSDYSQAKCAWCGGSGKWSVAPGSKTVCIVCSGKGKVSVAGQPSECRQCRGSGRSDRVNPCLTCAGTGWEKVSE
jgi:hypothetical protein